MARPISNIGALCNVSGCLKSRAARGDKKGFRAQCLEHYNHSRLSEKQRNSNNEYYFKLRKLVIAHYSFGTMCCACCGEVNFEFLSIDHVDGKGNEHRKLMKAQGYTQLPLWLKAHGFPEGFRILCYNCNLARGFVGYCPHERIG